MIKKATLSDVSFVYELTKEVVGSSFTKEALEHIIKKDEIYHLFISEDKTIKKGFIMIWHNDNFGQIIDLAVKPNYQNQGIGKALITYGLNFLKELNVNEISLEVRKSNEKAIHLYQTFGFTIQNEIRNYYDDEDGLLLRWVL